MNQELPPHDIQAEMSCIGAIILSGGYSGPDSQYAAEAINILSGIESFYLPKHQSIYRAVVELFDKNDGMDITMLHSRLNQWGVMDQIGGVDYLVEGTVMPVGGLDHAFRRHRNRCTHRPVTRLAGGRACIRKAGKQA